MHGSAMPLLASDNTMIPAITMQDELGIVYLVETPQQFWSELEDILLLPNYNTATLSQLDTTLKRFLSLCAAYHEQYLQSPLQLEHACDLILDSELFQFHSERMCDIIVSDAQTNTDPHSQLIFYHVLLCYGRRRASLFRHQKRWQVLIPLLMDHVFVDIDPDVEDTYFGMAGVTSTNAAVVPVPIEAKLRSLSVRLLYEVCRVQKFSLSDLRFFDESFIDYLFDLVEQTRCMQDETFNYSVIKLIVSGHVPFDGDVGINTRQAALNEQYMVASLDTVPDEKPKDSRNQVLRVLMRRLNLSKTFGENMIFMLNRAISKDHTPEDLCMQHLILKILYVLFTTNGTSEYFYTNDLRVLVDVFLRELVDLDEENESLRHTYLRVLHPLLTKTQLRDVPYKRMQLGCALESLVGNTRIRDVNPTTKRLVERCLNGDWCMQFRKSREAQSRDSDSRRGSPASESSGTLSPTVGAASTAAATHLQRTPSGRNKTLKLSKSVENLTGRLDQVLRTSNDDPRRPSNGSAISLPAAVAGSPPESKSAPPSANSRRKGSSHSEIIEGPYSNRRHYDPEMVTYDHDQHLLSPTACPPSPALSDSAMPQVKAAPRRRPPPPAPPKRRKPPAIPTSHGNGNGVTITTIRSSSSPLSKTAYSAGLQSAVG
ncbi:hypothetical protein AMATHDRAFT_49114 [Amanita thiersii Skay4041]|uniref:SPIN90/Ldb17 leucine-rich domain-containing protein n=1 Tax=Amanita thiersii Skay4041 TaxID=703135 RepID=A0A2A9NKY5_9AGAR|nr:hypothetical protein AMATHDRAFT_49114 [Amanita thiersii Skay4041]